MLTAIHRVVGKLSLELASLGVAAALTMGQLVAQHDDKIPAEALTTGLSSTNSTQVEDDPDEPTQEEKELRERVRRDLEIRAKQELAEREVLLETVVGRVVSPEEDPLSGIEILAFEGGKQLDQKFVTDKHGRFEVPKRWRNSDHYLTLIARDGTERLGWFDFFLHAHSDNGQKYGDNSFRIIMLPLDRTIRGRVTDQAGNPLGKIEVRVESLQHPVNYASFHWRYQSLNGEPLIQGAITDDEGWYELKLPDNTHAQLGAVHPDWIGKQITVTRENDRLAITTLDHAAKVAGRVVDSRTGRPLASVTIAAETNEPKMRAGGWAEARTDSDGNYLIGGLSAGQFNILVLKSRFKTLTAPGVVRELATGQTQRADISLSLGNRLTGRVVDAKTLLPISRCTVNYNGPARPGGAAMSVETNDAGEFEFVVPPGKSRIELGENREDVPDQSVEIDVSEDRDPEPIVLKAGRKLDSGDMKVFVGPPLDRKVSVDLQKVPLRRSLFHKRFAKPAMVHIELSDDVNSGRSPDNDSIGIDSRFAEP